MNFNEMNLKDFELNALNDLGFVTPTEIQGKTIPLILEGKDVIGKSKTGSGKTFAFGLPILNNLETFNKKTQALIISPTRELAEQTYKELKKLTKNTTGYTIVPVYGGVSMDRQLQEIRKGARIIVGTPGRIMDHLRRNTINLRHIKTLVLDEADEMLNMGFKEDVETILLTCNDTHQTVLFSATMPPEILAITKNYMKDPILVEIEEENDKVDVKEQFVSVGSRSKQQALFDVLIKLQPRITIVFTNTKRMTEQVAKNLKEYGYNAFGLHGDMRQGARRTVMNRFKTLKEGAKVEDKYDSYVLVATDVAARGIDITGVDLVVNYDVPNDENFYIHRIGRTGRGSRSGVAVSIANSSNQVRLLKQLAKKRKVAMTELLIDCSKEYSVGELGSELDFPVRRQKSASSSSKRKSVRSNFDDDKTKSDSSIIKKSKQHSQKKRFEERKPIAKKKDFEGKEKRQGKQFIEQYSSENKKFKDSRFPKREQKEKLSKFGEKREFDKKQKSTNKSFEKKLNERKTFEKNEKSGEQGFRKRKTFGKQSVPHKSKNKRFY